MENIIWIISPDLYKYDKIELRKDSLRHLNPYRLKLRKHRTKWKSLNLDCVFIHYFVKELTQSIFYRSCVIYNFRIWKGPDVLLLTSTKKNLIDYNWNERVYDLVRERCELEHALSWLSTLGGAFSALGDYFSRCAEIAGKISINQLKLAMRLGDPNIQSRCRLYLSLSLIQKKKYKLAARIIEWEYHVAKMQTVVDERLVSMCMGIWAKLQYEHSLYKNNRQIKR